jgi:phenylalanyl-tRNA synthetase alpha chain
MKGMKDLTKEERPVFGKKINEIKNELESIFARIRDRVEEAELQKKLGPAIDPTLPSPDMSGGGLHPLTLVRNEIVQIFNKIGFSVVEGTEAETEWFCFDALNTPDDHPARDEQDTLFFPEDREFSNVKKKNDERYLLRTHTSSVQIRTMLERKPPIRVIAPGRVFRRDTVDATHSANFHQVEGLYIDKNVTVSDLKAILDYLLKSLFGEKVKTRLRPSFFPFTEPSFEVDLISPNLGKLSNQWIEIMGCGIVDPNVFDSVGIDAHEWSGFAFGLGVERIAMLRHGIDDIRHFYQNDLRFLNQFNVL